MKARLAAGFVIGILLAAGAGAQTRKVQHENYERYARYAGDPVDEFHYWSMVQWSLVGPDKVIVWPTIAQAYLVTVEQPCAKLEWARSIGVTSRQPNLLSSKFDYVTFDNDRCRIAEIRPIDYRRMQKDEREAKQAPQKSG